MPLRLVNKDRTQIIEACGTKIHIQSMTIGDKERLVRGIQAVPFTGDPDEEKFKRLIELVANDAIVKIEGYDGQTPLEVLLKLEDVHQLREIIKTIIDHCDLSPEEIKNSSSSSEQPTPVSAGNVETSAKPDDEHVSTT